GRPLPPGSLRDRGTFPSEWGRKGTLLSTVQALVAPIRPVAARRGHLPQQVGKGNRPPNTLTSMGVETKAKAAVKKPAVHPNTWVFFEGDFAHYNDVRLGLMTHALHYGTAVFEGIRAYWNEKKSQLFLLEAAAHYDRMKRSANVM